MEGRVAPRDEINAAPTKAFFVDILVRDIPLEQAVLTSSTIASTERSGSMVKI